MNFPYLFIEQSQDSVDIEDIGNANINVINDDADEWYLQISTECGFCKIKQFGPLKVDLNEIPSGFNLSMFKIEYNEKKLYKIIYDFLNNDKRGITQVFMMDKESIDTRLKNSLETL